MLEAFYTDSNTAFFETKKLLRRGRALLLLAGLVALAFLSLFLPWVHRTDQLNSTLRVLDYVLILGIAGPGLTLYILRRRSWRALDIGYGIVYSRLAKLAAVSINWVALLIVIFVL